MKICAKICLMALAMVVQFGALAQVEVKNKIVLTGTTPNDKQVQGLARPDSANSAVNAVSVISGELVYDAATGTDTLALQFFPAPAVYTTGMQVNFKSPVTSHGSLWIDVNHLGVKPLFKNISQSIDSAEILANQAVIAVYDGTGFQVISKLNKPCPAGFIEVTPQYCIEQDEHDSLNYYSATIDCGNRNAKLCSWSEWYYACQKTSLGLANMNNNFEYVDDPANYESDLQIRVVGSPDCTASASINTAITTKRRFRCCYYKR